GGAVTVKEPVEVSVPPGVMTLIFGVATVPAGTVAVICVGESTEYVVASMPPNCTALAPVRFVPVMATEVPTGPLVGVKEVIVGGGGVSMKESTEVAVPPGVVTLMFGAEPVPAGTGAVILVAELTTYVVSTPPNLTLLALRKLVPVIVTDVPAGPLAGVKDVTVGGDGGAVTVNEFVDVSDPPGVVTLIFGVAPVPAG